MYMINHPNLKEKLIKEICPSVEAVASDIANGLTYETVSKFDFLHSCFYETLRKDPPVYLSLMQSFDADTKIGNIVFKKDDMFSINIKAMHHDPKQWKEPQKFVPERFDHSSDWCKTPSGGLRNSLAFNPFLGGRRGCLGKTFAETVIRFTIPILYYHFDFDFADQLHKIDRPVFDSVSCVTANIPIKLTTKNKAA
jgi:cytochrome P450